MKSTKKSLSSNQSNKIKALKKAASNNNSWAMIKYADIVQKGEGISVNPKEAAQYYKKAADLGNPIAMTKYATMQETGNGIPSNKEEATNYYKKAIDKGDLQSLVMLANISNDQFALYYYKLFIDKFQKDTTENWSNVTVNGESCPNEFNDILDEYKDSTKKNVSYCLLQICKYAF